MYLYKLKIEDDNFLYADVKIQTLIVLCVSDQFDNDNI